MGKNNGVAAVLSFFVPGLGQIYKGELGKGIVIVAVYTVSWMLTCIFIGYFILVPLWIWAIYDAYNNNLTGNKPA